jgi:hypothetical protein
MLCFCTGVTANAPNGACCLMKAQEIACLAASTCALAGKH